VRFLATEKSLAWENRNGDLIVYLPEFEPNRLKQEEMYAYAFSISHVKDFVRNSKIELKYYDFRVLLYFNAT